MGTRIDVPMIKRPRGRPKDESLIDGLDWDLFRFFYLVAAQGGYAQAGRKEDKAQPYLTQKIQTLEKALGFPVFVRHPHGIELTRKGDELFEFVQAFYLDLKARIKPEVTSGGRRILRIIATQPVMSYILADALIDFKIKRPDIALDLVSSDNNHDLAYHDADLAITIQQFGQKTDVVSVPFFKLQKKLYASQEYLARYGEPKTVEDLSGHKLICAINKNLYPFSDITWLLELTSIKNSVKSIEFSANNIECIVEYCKAGGGIIGAYNDMTLISQSGLVNILQETVSPPVSFNLVYPRHLQEDAPMLELVSHLQGCL